MLRLSLVPLLAAASLMWSADRATAGGPGVEDPKLISTPSTPIGETPSDFQWPLCTETGAGFGNLLDGFTGKVRFHTGLDFRGDFGSEVRAVAPGRVTVAERRGPYGLMVEIDHGSGYTSRYAQLQVTHVKPNDVVRGEQLVARVGSTGRSTGPHLHLEIRYQGLAIDPLRVLRPSDGCDGVRRPFTQSAPLPAFHPSGPELFKLQQSTRFAWPVCATEHAGFGYHVDKVTGRDGFHAGEDFKGPLGAPVRAAAKGRVLAAEVSGAYGLMIEIDHGHGFRTRYGHLHAVSVKPGDKIGRGQVIAKLGSSGRASRPILHFEIWSNNIVRDPMEYLERDSACRRER